ncbi:UAA-domain-containing protein [Ramaria rubella]|nr:UAA-domain-containing protein [Ramaria rubella]
MPEARQDIVSVLLHSVLAEWITTLALVFGGCCSNAWALELATSQNPHAGSLITFAQFLLVSIYGLRKHITVAPNATLRKDLVCKVAANILERYAKKPTAEQVFVAVEGPASVSHAFGGEVAHELELACPELALKRFTAAGTQSTNDVACLDGIWDLSPLEESIVLIDGEHLHSPKYRSKWIYSIFLTFPEVTTPLDTSGGAPLTDSSSLTIDISSPTHPIVVSPPLPKRYNPRIIFDKLTRLRLKKRSIPISRWLVQVALFFITSLLNNAAFGYNVPMAVHIIFRSGGLVVNMIMGWLIDQRRYNATQVLSVLLVTVGVVCTTLSASQPPASQMSGSSFSTPGSYFVGILILTLALIMSGFMGLAQDKAYAKYGRGHWQEAMFYLHFLALPGFTFLWRDLASQIQIVNASTKVEVGLESFVIPLQSLVETTNLVTPFPTGQVTDDAPILQRVFLRRLSIPSFYFPLLLNVMTQLLCVSGVHRLTSRVNSLTVTLVLVVRKALSLGISVVLLRSGRGGGVMLWIGAGLVLAGTIGYTVGSGTQMNKGLKEQDDTKKEQ